jgi:hypothetical protein
MRSSTTTTTMEQPQISQLIHQNAEFITKLARSKSTQKRQRLLKNATTKELLALAEICLNIVSSRFQLTTRQRKRLMPYAEWVRRMSRMKSDRGARKFATQKGSGIQGLFAALLTPILIELLRNKLAIKGKGDQ